MFWSTFLDQIFSRLCFYLQNIIDIVRLLLAAVSINGLIDFSNENNYRKIFEWSNMT